MRVYACLCCDAHISADTQPICSQFFLEDSSTSALSRVRKIFTFDKRIAEMYHRLWKIKQNRYFYLQIDEIAEAKTHVPVDEILLFFQQYFKTVVGVCLWS